MDVADEAKAASQATLQVEGIFLKSVSMETPEKVVAPSFTQGADINLEIRNLSRPLNEPGRYEVALEMLARARSGEETQLLVEVVQAGVVRVQNAPPEATQFVLNVTAPEMLYPYAAQLINDLLGRTPAPKIFLPPFDFRALYARKREMIEKGEQQTPSGSA